MVLTKRLQFIIYILQMENKVWSYAKDNHKKKIIPKE